MTAVAEGPAAPSADGDRPSGGGSIAEANRLAAIEQRLLHLIRWVVFGGVILLTVGAGALSWEHLTHIAATSGHIAPRQLLFLFPIIVDGFMVMSSGAVVRHTLTDEPRRRGLAAPGRQLHQRRRVRHRGIARDPAKPAAS